MTVTLEEIAELGMREKIREIYQRTPGEDWLYVRDALSYVTGLKERQIASIAAWSDSSFKKLKASSQREREMTLSVYENSFYQEMQEKVREVYSQTQDTIWNAMRKALATIYGVNENQIRAMAAWHTINNKKAELTDGARKEIKDAYGTVPKHLWPVVRSHYAERYNLTNHKIGGVVRSG